MILVVFHQYHLLVGEEMTEDNQFNLDKWFRITDVGITHLWATSEVMLSEMIGILSLINPMYHFEGLVTDKRNDSFTICLAMDVKGNLFP